MKLRIRTALMALPLLLSVSPAFAAFHGSYTVTFYVGSKGLMTSTQCITFKHTGTAVLGGYADSGTWKSHLLPGSGGNFVVDRGNLRFYGIFGSSLSVINGYALVIGTNVIGQGFDVWSGDPSAPVTSYGEGTFTAVPGCTTTAAPATHS
jgi:hypothetical protein